MTDSAAQFNDANQAQGTKLKHLEFVQMAALQAVMLLSSLYNFAKENVGPLRPGVQVVEGYVKAVVAPVYENIHDFTLQLLKLVDLKVDDFASKVERNTPSLLKQALAAARSAAGDMQRLGVVMTTVQLARSAKEKYSPVAQKVYWRYEPFIERYLVVSWRSLNKLPAFPQVAQICVSTAAHWTDKYNKTLVSAAERGYLVAEFLPFVPMERIAKVFNGDGGGAQTAANAS